MEFLYMCIVSKSHAKNIAEFPMLKPEAAYWQSLLIESMCTGIFVMANLLVKDPRSGFAGHGHGWMGCFTIASALAAMIFVAGPHSGASLNPAVSIALHCLKGQIMKAGTHEYYLKVYLVGPLLGAICAGLFSWAHRSMLLYVDPEAYFNGEEAVRAEHEAAEEAKAIAAELAAGNGLPVSAPVPTAEDKA